MANNSSASGFGGIVQGPLANKDGTASPAALQLFRDWNTRLTNSLNVRGQFIGIINAITLISGRGGTIGTALQHVSDSGVLSPEGMTSATIAAQGAVILPIGATGNTLGTAAIEPISAFDPAGAAATAQSNAETYADGAASTAQSNAETFASTAAATAQSNAESFASDASNIVSGTLATARLGGFTGTAHLAKLTTGGANGSLTITNGLITAVVDPT